MPCLVSLTGKDDDFQSLSWATWVTKLDVQIKLISPLRALVARVSRLNMRIPMSEVVRSLHRLGVLTKGQLDQVSAIELPVDGYLGQN